MQPVPQPPRKMSRKKPIIFGCLGAIVLLFIIIVITAVATNGCASQATTGATPTATTRVQATTAPTVVPTTVPTQAPTSAPTKAPAPSGLPATHDTPHLGGPLSDFIGVYGQPNSHSTPPQFHFITENNIDELIITGLGSARQRSVKFSSKLTILRCNHPIRV